MFDHEETDQDLKAFEARLAALRPRADGLDPARRARLEKEAAARRLCFSITPVDQQPGSSENPSKAVVMLKHNLRACTDPAGHRFVCVHCGSEARISTHRRWPWPTALAAVSGVAAVLLVMLVFQREPSDANVGSSGSADNLARPADSVVFEVGPPTPRASADTASYLCLREAVLRHGVAWLDRHRSTSALPLSATDKLLTNRELLDRLIEEEGTD